MKPICVALAAIFFLGAGQAQAGPAADALGKCLVQSSTGRDRVTFIRWLFAGMAQHPDVSALANASAADSAAASKAAAAVVDRLVLKDCRKEALAALRAEGDNALEGPFETFGRMAMQELMGDPAVNKQMDGFGTFLDSEAWAALDQEAKPAKP